MDNLWEDLFGTNQPPVICDPTTTTTSHGIEEPCSTYPKIGKVWSIDNPNDQLTPQPVVEGDEPLPPLRLKVQLPSRQSFLANNVHQLELVLLYGHLEEHVLMIAIHGSISSSSSAGQNESIVINSFLSSPPPPFPTYGDVDVIEELLENPLPPSQPPRKKIIPRRRKLKSKTSQIYPKKSNKSNTTTHSSLHLSQEEKEAVKEGWKNKCSICSKLFRAPSLLYQHLVHQTREKPPLCDKCRKQFNPNDDLLNTQKRLHDPATRRPFHCTQCDKSYTKNTSLTTHVNTVHRRLKPFQCPECGQKFGQKSTMMTHLNSVHLGIRHPCRKPNCGKSFSEKGHLRQHEKKAH